MLIFSGTQRISRPCLIMLWSILVLSILLLIYSLPLDLWTRQLSHFLIRFYFPFLSFPQIYGHPWWCLPSSASFVVQYVSWHEGSEEFQCYSQRCSGVHDAEYQVQACASLLELYSQSYNRFLDGFWAGLKRKFLTLYARLR